MEEKTITYIVLIGAFAILGWVVYGAFSTPSVQNTGLPAAAQTIPAECGDITDNANVQHLSHHPSQFGECIKLVDPAKFKEAVGMDKAQYMSQNGIQ